LLRIDLGIWGFRSGGGLSTTRTSSSGRCPAAQLLTGLPADFIASTFAIKKTQLQARPLKKYPLQAMQNKNWKNRIVILFLQIYK
jgi:hypothetical protein